MRLMDEVHPDKLRGGFYTNPEVVAFCLRQVRELMGEWPKRWLEPSAGDGAFVRGLAAALPTSRRLCTFFQAVELIEAEAAKCAEHLDEAPFDGAVVQASFFTWARSSHDEFDAVVGNPPYVRYQFVDESDRELAERLVAEQGLPLQGVSNLWLPFALVSLNRLRIGGVFSLVLPSELFCTTSGGQFRAFLVRHFSDICVDLFPRETFPDITQDVVVVSGRRAAQQADSRPVVFREHDHGTRLMWQHQVKAEAGAWLQYLLSEEEYGTFVAAKHLPGILTLGGVARIEVSIVTGANTFFTVDDETLERYQLHEWALPLLARTGDAPGVVFTSADQQAVRKIGSRAWLLDFSALQGRLSAGVKEYLAIGKLQGIADRYKCRIRDPWYCVPYIKRGSLMLTKRAHHYHRLLHNKAKVYTTDTIYRGDMLPLYAGREEDLVATFQNTLTLLSTEVEGRTYGGGVLELVPSEVARLSVPLLDTGELVARVDRLSRQVDGQKDPTHAVMATVDEFLMRAVPGYREVLPVLDRARRKLQARRHDVELAPDAS